MITFLLTKPSVIVNCIGNIVYVGVPAQVFADVKTNSNLKKVHSFLYKDVSLI